MKVNVPLLEQKNCEAGITRSLNKFRQHYFLKWCHPCFHGFHRLAGQHTTNDTQAPQKDERHLQRRKKNGHPRLMWLPQIILGEAQATRQLCCDIVWSVNIRTCHPWKVSGENRTVHVICVMAGKGNKWSQNLCFMTGFARSSHTDKSKKNSPQGSNEGKQSVEKGFLNWIYGRDSFMFHRRRA